VLVGKTILVTGAAGLLGKAVVKYLFEQGAFVIATDLDKDQLAESLASNKIDITHERLQLETLDLLDEDQVKGFFQSLNVIDGAVNCCYPRNANYGKHFFEVTMNSFNQNVSMSLGSAFLLTQQCAAFFMRTKAPISLVNVASIYGVVAPDFSIYQDTPMTMPVEYAAIKSALIHLNKYAVNYIGDSAFRVNSVSPGGLLDGQPESFLAAYKNKALGQGMLSSDDITGTIGYLLSQESKFLNGQNLVVDDGFSL